MSRSEPSPGRSPSPLQEARPLHTSEIGSLKKLPDHGTEWLGSSSGVYFVNTVRRAFNATISDSGSGDDQNFPAAEDILAGRDTPAEYPQNQDVRASTDDFEALLYSALGELPERKTGMELSMVFFRAWHPLFPFLHGPTFLQDMETLYSTQNMHNGQPATTGTYDVRKRITFQLVINIAGLSHPALLPASSRIKSSTSVSLAAGILAASHSIPTIQTLLAAELYLVSTIALRAASTCAGMVLRSIFQTGLHRCPLRYASLSPSDCELRKRIFWSAYALDRHLSQSLGDPITLQDSDIDVCLSGRELHSAVPVTSSGPMLHPKVLSMHLPQPASSSSSSSSSSNATSDSEDKRRREAALTAYVQYSRLTGRVIEIFHKSIHARFPKREAIVYLTSDIETWWNELPPFLSGSSSGGSIGGGSDEPVPVPPMIGRRAADDDAPPQQQPLVPFFSILYQQLLLLLNRPALSLDPRSAEFQHGLQLCIRASRTTLTSLKAHRAKAQSMFLPSLLSATWMAGLIIAFACLLGKYQKARACADINTCLELLQATNSRYNTARQCYLVLSSLLVDIKQRKASSTGYLALYRLDKGREESPPGKHENHESKRRRMNPNANADESRSERSPSGMSTETARGSMRHGPSTDSNPTSAPVLATLSQQTSTFAADTDHSNQIAAGWNAAQPIPSYPSHDSAYVSSTFQAAPEYSFSSMPGMPDTMPTLDPSMDMSVFGGMNFNMVDVFESATWENLIGSTTSSLPIPDWDGTGQMSNG